MYPRLAPTGNPSFTSCAEITGIHHNALRKSKFFGVLFTFRKCIVQKQTFFKGTETTACLVTCVVKWNVGFYLTMKSHNSFITYLFFDSGI